MRRANVVRFENGKHSPQKINGSLNRHASPIPAPLHLPPVPRICGDNAARQLHVAWDRGRKSEPGPVGKNENRANWLQ